MVRWYICGTQCAGDEAAFVCEHCGCTCHQACLAASATDRCPNCVGEPVIGAFEF